MASFSTRSLAKVSARRPWYVVAAWVAALVIFGGLNGALGLKSTTDVKLENNPESVQGWNLLEDHQLREERHGIETIVVRSDDKTVDDQGYQDAVNAVTSAVTADPKFVTGATNYFQQKETNPDARKVFVSADGKATIVLVTLAGTVNDATEHAKDYLKLFNNGKNAAPGFTVMTVGDASLNDEINKITEDDLKKGEGIGATIALIILVVVFGALLAAIVPVILAFMSIGIAFGITALVSQLGELSFFVTNMITMIGLAVGIDYSLFVISRYREERVHGRSKKDAITISG